MKQDLLSGDVSFLLETGLPGGGFVPFQFTRQLHK